MAFPPPPPAHPAPLSGLNQQFGAMNMNGPSMANMPNMPNMPNMSDMPNMPNMPNMSNMAKSMKDKASHVVDGGSPFSHQPSFGNGNMTSYDDGPLEGYIIRKAEPRNATGPPTWRETTLKSMFHSPHELLRLVEKQERERKKNNKDLSDLCDELSHNKNKAVHDAVDGKNRLEMDPNYRWSPVYLNAKSRDISGGFFARPSRETHAIELILQRFPKNANARKSGFKSPNDNFSNQFNGTNSMKPGNMAPGMGMGMGLGVNMNGIKQGKMPQVQGMTLPQQKFGNPQTNTNLPNMAGLNGMKNMPQNGAPNATMQNGMAGMAGMAGMPNGGAPKIIPMNLPKGNGNLPNPPRSSSPIIVMADGPSKKSRAMSNGQFNKNAKLPNFERQARGSNYIHKMKANAMANRASSSSESESDSDGSYTSDSEETYPSSYSSRHSKQYRRSSKGYPNARGYVKPHRSSRRTSDVEGVTRYHHRSSIDPEYSIHPRMMNNGPLRQDFSGMRPPPHRSSSISYSPQYDHRTAVGYGTPVINQFQNPRAIMENIDYADEELYRRQEQAMEHQARARGQAYMGRR